ncbi:VP6 [CHeRI orbivirus 2-1]|nr:VP6 [CHeRI orbivirus 2-1]
MSRIVLLAPGDVILQCRELFERRGVEIKVENFSGNQSVNSENLSVASEKETGGDNIPNQDDQSHDVGQGVREHGLGRAGVQGSDANRNDTRLHQAGDSTVHDRGIALDSMARGLRHGESKVHASVPVLLDPSKDVTQKSKKEKAGRVGAEGRRGGEGEEETFLKVRKKSDSREGDVNNVNNVNDVNNVNCCKHLVLSEDIQEKLRIEYDIEVDTTAKKVDFSSEACVVELGPRLLKSLELAMELKEEQSDELKRVKRLCGGGKRKTLKFLRFDSEKGLLELLGGKKKKKENEKDYVKAVPTTRVTLVTNSIKDVGKAHIMFTTPTGDPNWKEVARQATKRSNIRVYNHQGGTTETLHESIDALLDVA